MWGLNQSRENREKYLRRERERESDQMVGRHWPSGSCGWRGSLSATVFDFSLVTQVFQISGAAPLCLILLHCFLGPHNGGHVVGAPLRIYQLYFRDGYFFFTKCHVAFVTHSIVISWWGVLHADLSIESLHLSFVVFNGQASFPFFFFFFL